MSNLYFKIKQLKQIRSCFRFFRLSYWEKKLKEFSFSIGILKGWKLYDNKKINIKLLLNLNSYVDWLIYRDGIFEGKIIQALHKHLNSNKYTWFVDIGSNIGQMSLWVAKHFPQIKIIAFEPFYPVYLQHKINQQINGLNYIIENFALHSKTDVLKLFVPKWEKGEHLDRHNYGMVSIYSDRYRPKENMVQAQAISFDEYFNQNHVTLGEDRVLFKIDVEGAELFVIEGMQKKLDQFKNITIFLELLFHFHMEKCKKVVQILLRKGFRAFTLNDQPIFSFEDEQILCGNITDFIFIKNS